MAPTNYDPEPFVKDGVIVRQCRSCGLDVPLSDFQVEEDLSDSCASCREDRGRDLVDEMEERSVGRRITEGFTIRGDFD